MNEIVLKAVGLSKTYREGVIETEVLKSVSLEVPANARMAIVGSSGSGKSTLLHILGGLDVPSKGEVLLKGRSFSSLGEGARCRLRNRHVGFVYQFHHLLPELSALENVMMPLIIRRTPLIEARHQAAELLGRVGLNKRLDHRPAELSGGERQRVAVARALISRPSCLLADEPTGNLDSQTAHQVLDLMLELNEQLQTALLIVTHDPEIAARVDRVVRLKDGVLEEASCPP
ncbi:lipoprotein-releasing ABC transporter ATP-binding protein LolD [Sulfurivirga sp.]|uniref:lipoprotein-releasing ABC transporter ATP-binding protein LolD n=1 Tax=Sulfurivirga sp. TaxID=2614236 RepID=UPI0025F77A8A|nr:lipoprotein-releasing ABC transporter ATP-binding protein LolD [Sulfurivirga sp.]